LKAGVIPILLSTASRSQGEVEWLAIEALSIMKQPRNITNRQPVIIAKLLSIMRRVLRKRQGTTLICHTTII